MPLDPRDLEILAQLAAQPDPSVGQRLRTFGLGAADALTNAYGGRSQYLPMSIDEERLKRKQAVDAYIMRKNLESQAAERDTEVSKFEEGKRQFGVQEGRITSEAEKDRALKVSEGEKERRNELSKYLLSKKADADTKKSTSDEKKQQLFSEIEDRRQNINAAIDSVDAMIEKGGTYEAFGSHNADMNRLIDQIATDMAKLQDPESIARPGEVELVKKSLVQSGMFQRNSTARKILQNFKGEVGRRADSAYKTRGFEPPAQTQKPPPEGASAPGLSDTERSRLEELRRKKAEGRGQPGRML